MLRKPWQRAVAGLGGGLIAGIAALGLAVLLWGALEPAAGGLALATAPPSRVTWDGSFHTPGPTPPWDPLPQLPGIGRLFEELPAMPEGKPGVAAESGADYRLVERYHLSCVENHGNHHIYIHVVDAGGRSLPGVQVAISWPSGREIAVTEAGKGIEFPMYKGAYRVQVLGGSSEATTVTSDLPDECPGNTRYHHSWRLVFQRRW